MGLMRIQVTVPAVLDRQLSGPRPAFRLATSGCHPSARASGSSSREATPTTRSGPAAGWKGGARCWYSPEGSNSQRHGRIGKLTGPTVSVNDGALDVT